MTGIDIQVEDKSNRSDHNRNSIISVITTGTTESTGTTNTSGSGGDVEAQLFKVCARALSVTDDDYDYCQRWDSVRAWFLAYEGHEIFLAKSYSSMNLFEEKNVHSSEGMTALHLICCHSNPPLDIVRIFLFKNAALLAEGDASNCIPLTLACKNNASADVVKLLLDGYPNGVNHRDLTGKTPLLQLLTSPFEFDDYEKGAANMADVVRLLCSHGAANVQAEDGKYPIHFASAFGYPTSVISVLAEFFPDAIQNYRDNQGRTPLHYAMSNCALPSSNKTIRVLLKFVPDVVDAHDHRNKTPLDFLLMNVPKRYEMEDKTVKNIETCLDNYLDGKPKATFYFMTSLTKLPDWLKDFAVEKDSVKELLNRKLTEKIPTAIYVIQIYMYFIIVLSLPKAAKAYIEQKPISQQNFISVILVTSYFLVWELIQMIGSISLSEFRRYLFNLGNIVDLGLIACLAYIGVELSLVYKNEQYCDLEDSTCKTSMNFFRSVTVITLSLIFLSSLKFIQSIIVEFAVFVNGVVFVIKRIFEAFIWVLAIFVLAFSQIFFFMFRSSDNCETLDTEDKSQIFAHCTFSRSVLRTIQGLTGEVNPTDYITDSKFTTFFFALFIFMIIILLVNVLIAIVVDNFGIIKNERAAIVFWSNRMDYIAEIDGLKHTFLKLFRLDPLTHRDSFDQQGSEFWSKLRSISKNKSATNLVIMFSDFLKRILAYLIMFLWFVVGFLSAGYFWPQQIREAFLSNKAVSISKYDIVEEVSAQIHDLRKEVDDLKNLAKVEMENDRKEIIGMKEEAEALQKEITGNMTQITEFMKILLIQRRTEQGLDPEADLWTS